MSYLRIEKHERAYEIFQRLAQDPLRNYYALAAQSRLDGTVTKTKSPFSFFRSRMTGFQFMAPDLDVEVDVAEEIDD